MGCTLNKGLFYLLLCYFSWGFLSIYWHALNQVPAIDILFYRVIFSFLTMLIILLFSRKVKMVINETKSLINHPKSLLRIFAASILITINWGSYIIAVTNNHATEASVGYYIMPLLNVAIGVIIFREKLSRSTLIALILSIFGVSLLVILQDNMPISVFVMALAFAFYGLVKKGLKLSTLTVMTLETALIFPFGIIYFFLFSEQHFWQYNTEITLLIIISGLVTTLPLILYAESLKTIRLSTIGSLQYLNPTIQLVVAVFILKESYPMTNLFAFAAIWLGVIVFALDRSTRSLKLNT